MSAGRDEDVDRPTEVGTAEAVQGQRVHARHDRLGAGDSQRRLDAFGSARRGVAQQDDTGLQPSPWSAVATSFLDRAAGEAQRDQVGGRGHVVAEHAGDGVEVEQSAVRGHASRKAERRNEGRRRCVVCG
jgi:hypothetical protein